MGKKARPLTFLYFLVLVALLSSVVVWILHFRLQPVVLVDNETLSFQELLDSSPSYLTETHLYNYYVEKKREREHRESVKDTVEEIPWHNCRMESCFNFEKCKRNSFKVYVYPVDKFVPSSETYEKILKAITASSYYTPDPSQACLFVLSIDTLDRDELSRDFVRNVPSRLNKLPLWNNGENHIVFNLYAGTWPQYNETELGFQLGKAILAKASMSIEQYRPNFDISIPLFHRTHPDKGDDTGTANVNEFPSKKKHLIAFKGKRYVYGIGSDTRNSVYHLHNGNDVVMVTTCKHGKNWKEMKDERCDEDNKEYEKYDYDVLLQNSTFCLVPRGRRLGSFRFLEALKAGCIPVLLSNGWVLPFSEVIDWTETTLTGDERSLFQVLDMVRSIDDVKIFSLKQQSQILWNQYMSSIEKIIETTFEIIRDRIRQYTWRDSTTWNTSPGALSFDVDYADDLSRFPFHHEGNATLLKPNFTAVIYVQSGISGMKSSSLSSYSNSPLFRLVRSAGKSNFISKILIVWDSGRAIPKIWPEISVPLVIKRSSSKSVSQRFITDGEVETDAVFSLDEDAVLSTDELDFAYIVWRSFPDRIVGYPTRSHYWDDPTELWKYSSKWTNDYSMVLAGGAIYHVYYNHLYWNRVPPAASQLVESIQNCEDILMNMIVERITRKPPIKLTYKRSFKDLSVRSSWNDPEHFKQRHNCVNQLAEIFGSVPLKRSSLRLDPILFRDPVSNMRKNSLKRIITITMHESCSNDAVIDIDQTEFHELPKSLQERLKKCLGPLHQLVFYPYARIDCASRQVLTHIKNEENKLILRLEHKSNIKMSEKYGFGTGSVSSLFKTDCLYNTQKDQHRDGTSSSHLFKFSDDRGNLIFSSVALKEITKVICDREVLATINGKALEFLSTPNLLATNEKGEIIIEIRINDNTTTALNKPRNHYMIYAKGNQIIGKISLDASQKGSRFGVTFLKDLDSSIKAVILTSSFLLYCNMVSKPQSGSHQIEEREKCCIADWSLGKSIPVVVITLVMSIFVTVTLLFTV
ncbi:unnamed protein product [Allacma fusca]|uniref:Exostosin-1 n=1 Tax=Allacma fusca TaxID=39272 RepID=A0A8J2K7Y2_9HEXA|nr:unnamed protein product [Allacma fusca]